MPCCCRKQRKVTVTPPVVAVVGSTGYVGKCLMPHFLEALNQNRLRELRVITSEAKLESDEIKTFTESGAKAFTVNYEDVSTISSALKGVDVTVSALGIKQDGIDNVKKALLDALEVAKVKVYFPSEFGTNHYRLPSYSQSTVNAKREHYKEAKRRGLNPIRMLTGGIMESFFGKRFKLDCVSREWKVVADGADKRCALTAERDLGPFTLEAVLRAHADLESCPDELEVCSDNRTLREYAKAFEAVSGKEITISSVSLEESKKEFEADPTFPKLLMIMLAENAFDYTKSTGNTLLNPNESRWKLKKIEEFARETGGIPGNELFLDYERLK